MKNIKRLVICLVLVFSVFSFVPQLHADSGFDSSWDSGSSSWDSGSSSWDSGSSWDYGSSSSSYGSYSSGDSDWSGAALFVFSALYFIIVMVINTSILEKKMNSNNRIGIIVIESIIYLLISFLSFPEAEFSLVFLFIGIWLFTGSEKVPKNTENNTSIFKDMSSEDIKKYLGEDFDKYKFYKDVFKIYKDVQIAWMNKDIDSVRNVLTDEMYNMYRAQVETLKIKSQTNVMEDIEYIYASILDIKIEKDKKIVSVLLNVKCKDYLVDKDNNVIKGYKNRNNDYTYRLTFISTNEKENICPNCGAKVEKSNSSICDYCHSSLVNSNYSWTLSKKEMIRQR